MSSLLQGESMNIRLLFFIIFFGLSGMVTAQDVNLQDLQKRLQDKEVQLSNREKMLNEKEKRLMLLENELNSKQKELEQIRSSLQKMYDEIMTTQDEDVNKLVKTLSNTKPKSAAAIIEKMDMDKAVKVLRNMDPRKAGAIMTALGKSNPDAAAKISDKLVINKK